MKLQLFLFFFFLNYVSWSQNTDSLAYPSNNTDTVFVYEEPVTVNKTVYVHIPPVEKKRSFYLTLATAISTGTDFYDVCPNEDCKKHLENIKSTTKPYINNSIGINLAYSPKKIFSEIGISYSIYRDKFNYTYTDSLSPNINYNKTNTYKYIDINLTSGYWFNKGDSKISFLLKGGISMSRLLSSSGYTLSKVNTGDVIGLTDEVKLYDYTYRILADVKTLYKISNNLYVQLGFAYSYDIRSIIKSKDLYTRQRNVFGLSFGITHSF